LFDRYQAGERAILVHLDFPDDNTSEDLQEFEMLVNSAGITALNTITGKRATPHPKYFVGTGKVQEVADAVRMFDANIVLFNQAYRHLKKKTLKPCVNVVWLIVRR
jgi:GTP-binding protein HflX